MFFLFLFCFCFCFFILLRELSSTRMKYPVACSKPILFYTRCGFIGLLRFLSGMNKDGQDWLFPNLDPQPGGMENNGRAGVTMEVAIERFETLHETLVHDAGL